MNLSSLATPAAPIHSPLLRNTSPSWEREGRGWPHRETSRFVTAGGVRFHVQRMGEGPVVLLVHGTGAATHSWRDLAPQLARRFTVVALDLPGHGFSSLPRRARHSLPAMSDALGALLDELDLEPTIAVGHSAGAAIVCRMTLDGVIAPQSLVSLNGALRPMGRVAEPVLGSAARLVTWAPLVPWWVARTSRDDEQVARMLRGTGSQIDARGLELYARLIRCPGHVAGALWMMAHWNLRPLLRDLPTLDTPLSLVVGAEDRYVPPSDADWLCRRIDAASRVVMQGAGHLAHEEQPEKVTSLIESIAEEHGLL